MISVAMRSGRTILIRRAVAARRRIRTAFFIEQWGGWTAPPFTPRFARRATPAASNSSKSSPVAHAIDRAGVIVRDQQRAVLHLPRVHRSAPDLIALQPAFGERLVLGHVALPQRHHHHAEADLLAAVPRAALREEDAVLVLGGEHRASVELDTVARDVRAGLQQRRGELPARPALAELRIRDVALMAVWIAEVQPLLGRHVETVARDVFAEPVTRVGGEVELLRHRMPVEADAVAHAVRPVLEPGAIRVHARDVGVRVGRDTDVAGRADVEVELAVGPEGQVLPAVRRILRQRVVDHLHLGRAVELALDAFHLRDAMDRGDVERAVLEGDASGQVQALGDRLHLARAALVNDGVDIAGDPAGHEQRALVAPGHHARVVDTARPELDLEALGHLDLVYGNLARGLRGGRLRDGRERRALHLLGLTLLPGGWGGRLLRGDQTGGEHDRNNEGERQHVPQRAKPHDGSSGTAEQINGLIGARP